MKSPRRSVRRNSAATGLSDRSVRRILHKDLNFHSYKIVIVQELSDRDMANHRISSEQLLEILNDDDVISTVLMTDEAHFHLSGYGTNKIVATGRMKIHKTSISVLSTSKV